MGQPPTTNRLTGHSPGFFSVYTLPPNQAMSIEAQKRINEKRNQIPSKRNIEEIILKKSRSLLSKLDDQQVRLLRNVATESTFITGSCDSTSELADSTVSLVVTSPPFLDVVDYQKDNWLRCWFNGIDSTPSRSNQTPSVVKRALGSEAPQGLPLSAKMTSGSP